MYRATKSQKTALIAAYLNGGSIGDDSLVVRGESDHFINCAKPYLAFQCNQNVLKDAITQMPEMMSWVGQGRRKAALTMAGKDEAIANLDNWSSIINNIFTLPYEQRPHLKSHPDRRPPGSPDSVKARAVLSSTLASTRQKVARIALTLNEMADPFGVVRHPKLTTEILTRVDVSRSFLNRLLNEWHERGDLTLERAAHGRNGVVVGLTLGESLRTPRSASGTFTATTPQEAVVTPTEPVVSSPVDPESVASALLTQVFAILDEAHDSRGQIARLEAEVANLREVNATLRREGTAVLEHNHQLQEALAKLNKTNQNVQLGPVAERLRAFLDQR